MARRWIRPLVDADIPGALRLSTQSGWNQLQADWRRLIALWPQYCFAIEDAHQVIATGTLAMYDLMRIGWIGMILVDESHRGQGLGGAMMDYLITVADENEIEHLGLDATDQGRPVYARRGFVDQVEMARCSGRPSRLRVPAKAETPEIRGCIAALDRSAVGVDRLPLIGRLAAESGAVARAVGGRAFGMARRGRQAAHIGPIVADDPSAAGAIFDVLCDALAQQDCPAAIIDLPIASALMPHVQSRGFAVRRRLLRMSRPRANAPLLCGPLAHAICGFEMG